MTHPALFIGSSLLLWATVGPALADNASPSPSADQNFIITGGRKIDVIDPESRGFTIAFKRKRFHRLLIHLSFTLPGLPVACFLTTLLLSEKTILSPMPNPP